MSSRCPLLWLGLLHVLRFLIRVGLRIDLIVDSIYLVLFVEFIVFRFLKLLFVGSSTGEVVNDLLIPLDSFEVCFLVTMWVEACLAWSCIVVPRWWSIIIASWLLIPVIDVLTLGRSNWIVVSKLVLVVGGLIELLLLLVFIAVLVNHGLSVVCSLLISMSLW